MLNSFISLKCYCELIYSLICCDYRKERSSRVIWAAAESALNTPMKSAREFYKNKDIAH